MRRLNRDPIIEPSQARNDCGPCATTMVLNYFGPDKVTVSQVAREMRAWRVPWVGATISWGISRTLHKHGMVTAGGWFGELKNIKTQVDADHPVIVLVRPTDLDGIPFYSLHYRVVVGYNDSAEAPGGGELFFGCSASHATQPDNGNRPGNVALSYERFRRQWLTWASFNWYIAAYPRKAGLGQHG